MQPRTRMQNTNYRSTCMHVLFHALFQRAWQAWHVVDNHGHFEAKGGGQTSGMPRLTGPSMTIEKSTAHQLMQPLELHHLHPVLLQNQNISRIFHIEKNNTWEEETWFLQCFEHGLRCPLSSLRQGNFVFYFFRDIFQPAGTTRKPRVATRRFAFAYASKRWSAL